MPDDSIELREHYVYALLREDGQTPFYIGLGNRHRWLRHEREFDGRNGHKENIIRKMQRSGFAEIPKVKLAENLSRKEAAQLEIDLIRLIGRHPLGPLSNLTSGGDGIADIPAESRRRQRQATVDRWQQDPEGMMKGIRAAAIAALAPDVRARRADSVRLSWQNPTRRNAKKAEWSDERRANARALMTSPEFRARLDAGCHEARDKHAKNLRAALATPEAKANKSAASKAMWAARKQEILLKRMAKRRNRPKT